MRREHVGYLADEALGIAASRQHASARVGHRHDGILGKRDIPKQRLQPFQVHADRQHGDDSLGRVPHRIREHDDRLPADDTGLKLRDDRFSGHYDVLHVRQSDGFADGGAARDPRSSYRAFRIGEHDVREQRLIAQDLGKQAIALRAIERDDLRIADEGRRHRVDSGQILIQIRSRRRRDRAGLLAQLRLSLLPRHVRGPKPGGNERHEQEHGHDADLPPERLIAEDMHAFARF